VPQVSDDNSLGGGDSVDVFLQVNILRIPKSAVKVFRKMSSWTKIHPKIADRNVPDTNGHLITKKNKKYRVVPDL
jgi:hypothetical protein